MLLNEDSSVDCGDIANEDLASHVGDNFIKVITATEQPPGKWHHVMATYDGSMKASGVHLYVNGVQADVEVTSDNLTDTIETSVPMMIGTRYGSYPFTGWVDDVRIYDRELSTEEAAGVFESGIQQLVRIPGSDRSVDQQDVLSRAYSDDVIDQLESQVRTARKNLNELRWRGRQWCVNQQQQTMVILPADPGRQIPHDFAISACEVTVKQWQRTPKEIELGINVDRTTAPTDDCPMHNVSWHEVARYCNWLSEQDSIPEKEWVFEDNGTRIRENYQSLRGYRLPTHAEWKYACLAGSKQEYCFGTPNELAGNYAW